MAQAAIFLQQKDNPSNTGLSIVDTVANINALWTLASTLVNGYMDFTSYKPGLYARYAQGYTSPVLNPAGAFTGQGVINGAQVFAQVGPAKVGKIGASCPVDGTGLIATQKLVNEIRLAVLNMAEALPS